MTSRTFSRLAAVALAVAATSTLASPARAADGVSFALTFFASVTLGDKPTVGFGTDFRLAALIGKADNHSCNDQQRGGMGPFAQVTWLVPAGARFAAGFHGAGELKTDGVGIDGELGWTYRLPMDGGAGGNGLQIGISPVAFPVNAAARGTFSWYGGRFVPEGTVALGAGYPQLFNPRSICETDFVHPISEPPRPGGAK